MKNSSKHYQSKFIDVHEAKADAKEQSVNLKIPIAVIQSKSIFYADSNITPMNKEKLIVVYKDGVPEK